MVDTLIGWTFVSFAATIVLVGDGICMACTTGRGATSMCEGAAMVVMGDTVVRGAGKAVGEGLVRFILLGATSGVVIADVAVWVLLSPSLDEAA